jgi:hypothetical protein
MPAAVSASSAPPRAAAIRAAAGVPGAGRELVLRHLVAGSGVPTGRRHIQHIGSAHDDAELAVLKAAAQQRMTAGPGELDLGLDRTVPAVRPGGPLLQR